VLEVRLNARVIVSTPAAAVLDEMRRTGATEHGIQRMRGKAETLAVALENIDRRQANLMKQEMLAAGGDVAVSHGICGETVGETRVVVVGTRRQMDAWLARLVEEPFDLPAVALRVRAALDGYARRRFDIPMGDRVLSVGPRPALVGVVNVTPDSFSDGGKFASASAAVQHALTLAEEGADVLDIGGESTRPGSEPVDEREELARVLPVIRELAPRTRAVVSIDTRHPAVAREAVAAGARIINDITGLQGDPEMAAVAARSGAAVIVMHMLGEPRSMQERPAYDNLMADIARHLRRGVAIALEAGVKPESIIVDPGLGFGKTLAHNVEILARLAELRTLGRPILVGASRKRFIGDLTGVPSPAERTVGTAAACALAVAGGALLLRVHDVRLMRQAVAVAAAVAAGAGLSENVS
jgi:dihydropteroate synthase